MIADTILAVASPAQDIEVEDAIRERARTFSAAYVAGDLTTIMDIYCEDAVIAPPRRGFLGGDAVEAYWRPNPAVTTLRHLLEPVTIEVFGSIAIDRGFYSGAQERDGEQQEFRGKYLVVWERRGDGQWCMQQDMWNAAN